MVPFTQKREVVYQVLPREFVSATELKLQEL